MADQVTYSFTNFVLTALVAHHSSSRDFGVYSLLLASFLVTSATNRGLWAEPLIINFSTASEHEWRRASLLGLGRATVFGAGGGVVLLVLTSGFLPDEFSPLGYIFATALPILFAQDFLRYAAFARGRPLDALANDATVAAVQIAAAIVAVAIGVTAPTVFVGVWAVAGLFGALVGIARLGLAPPERDRGQDVKRPNLAVRLGIDNAITQLAQQSTGYAVAGVAGLAAAGGLRAAQTAYSPSAILSVGVQSAVVPELVRIRQRSLAAMRRAMFLVGSALMAVSIAFAVIIPLLPDSLGTSVLGPSWKQARPVLIYIGLAQAASVPAGVAQAGLRALADARSTVHARLVAVGLLLIVAIPLAAIGGIVGAGIGLAAGGTLQSMVWLLYFRRSFRSRNARDHS